MNHLVVTRTLPDAVMARVSAQYKPIMLNQNGAFAIEAFLAAADGVDAALVTPADRIDAAVIARIPASVRVLGTFSVGTDHIDLEAARARGLPVVNTPGVLSFATAELALTLMLMAARRASEAERLVRAGGWSGWTPDFMMGRTLEGKTLGILGLGRIGLALAAMARGLSMGVIYHNRREAENAAGAEFIIDEADFLRRCDVLSIHLPGGEATRHWLNQARIAMIKPGAIVVNTGRGSTIDDAALVAALRSGQIAAAGLDVFAHEPAVPAAYLTLENIVLLPHIGSATLETRVAMGMLALDGIDAMLAGRDPSNRVV
ncbi:MAG TPA: D-glycerate dehydrogenase [Acidiphilium sp.]|nr:MAG: D-glycerate dehydrogenase [Acidiphilium sp. 21-60-14]OYV90712.1 MAG: D-glycerate dehydrogenase [Acidiphilium sp. 37-60-79]OZB40065.1 MAG: D-glycerate dehydrogenase [Acidiphilium sp. 34-60-192]HQT89033.1 D-glycerate dehydrogenase [Acidiphilium sp.]HQU24130.1 D-glycerate dehydrogenase [Acidiphilium sp.]